MLKDVTGMAGVSLAPMAGAQGEFAGVAMIRACHAARGDRARRRSSCPMRRTVPTLPPRPCAASRCARSLPIATATSISICLRAAVGPQTAGLMLTNPSTLGVFEQRILDIRDVVHAAGGLLYYDGANLNAILGKVKPGAMGFDVIHINLHKTFSTPHGGGGPGSGAGRRCARISLPLPADPDGRPRSARATAGSRRRTARSLSAACPRTWAMPGCCCARTCTPVCSGAKACRASPSMRRSTPTI